MSDNNYMWVGINGGSPFDQAMIACLLVIFKYLYICGGFFVVFLFFLETQTDLKSIKIAAKNFQ